jgi:hypothetical protein
MNRRILPAVMAVSMALVFVSCQSDDNDNGSAPVLSGGVFASSASNLASGIEAASFVSGSYIWFRFTVTDEDLDAQKLIITQKSGTYFREDPTPLEKQIYATQAYAGYAEAALPGAWEISAYCVDSRGNRSNTITKNITITS